MTLRGRWAQGLQPRFFCWIIKDRLAAAERPGGFARNHRKVRRQEELIWLKSHGFTRVVSLLDSPHNLHAYEEAELVYERLPLGRHDAMAMRLRDIFEHLTLWLDDPDEKVFLHHEEFGDRVLGVLAGYLVYSGLVQEGPHAISVIEKITGRNLGADGREMVAVTLSDNLRRTPRVTLPTAPPPTQLPRARVKPSTDGPSRPIRSSIPIRICKVPKVAVLMVCHDRFGRVFPSEVIEAGFVRAEVGCGVVDCIRIAGLRESGVHGVLPQERVQAQPFEVNLELQVDLAKAGASDDLADTVDYSAVCDAVSRVVSTESYQLLERLAQRIAEVCTADPRVVGVVVEVRKLEPPVNAWVDHVAVRIKR